MPTAMTFSSLQDDLRGYLERGQVTDTTVYNQLPRLINNAEREIASGLHILGVLESLQNTLSAGVSVYTKPDRWKSTVSMFCGIGSGQNERSPIYTRGYEYCRRYWPNPSVSDVAYPPKFYADYDYTHWVVVPTPAIDMPWEVNAYMQPPLLDVSNQTNWLTEYAPTTLLYRSLVECLPFIKEDERTATFMPMYQESLSKLNGQDLQRILDRASARESN